MYNLNNNHRPSWIPHRISITIAEPAQNLKHPCITIMEPLRNLSNYYQPLIEPSQNFNNLAEPSWNNHRTLITLTKPVKNKYNHRRTNVEPSSKHQGTSITLVEPLQNITNALVGIGRLHKISQNCYQNICKMLDLIKGQIDHIGSADTNNVIWDLS